MTDPRMGGALWPALERLPRGAGVVVRHYGAEDRAGLIERIARIARKRGLVMVVAEGRGRVNVHNARRSWAGGLQTASAHRRSEAISAIRRGADLIFLSPVFATRSHPDAKALGRVRFGMLSRNLGVPVIALGGMNAARAKSLPKSAYGWAGIDAWLA
jgi:thiamine-phosphate pyrophosphorylase